MPDDADSAQQSQVIAFLERPESYPHQPARVERIDTHGAVIFLAGDRVYKMKRAVKLAYLDFSTLEKRCEVCERELALNRQTAPQLYVRTVPVTADGGHFQLDGEGAPVEWLIEMHRFDQNALFDRMAEAGTLDHAMVEKLAVAIKHFHEQAAEALDADWPESLRQVLNNVTHALSDQEFSALGLADTIAAMRERFDADTALLRQRRDTGYVRRCHGDMHLKNIVLLAGEPRLFDALEFDEEMRTIDVLFDLAFLLMDLWRRGLRGDANMVLNLYLSPNARGRDYAGLALLPLFIGLRSGIRAMTGLDELAVIPDEKVERFRRETHDYALLTQQFFQPPPPQLIAIGGLSGTGKTTVARAIAPEIGPVPGAIHLRSDVIRKALLGVEPHVRLGADAYSEAVNRDVYARMFANAEAVLSAGHAVILDATFTGSREQDALRALGRRFRLEPQAFWLEADSETMIRRVETRRGDASDANAEIVRQQVSRNIAPPAGWQRVNASTGLDETVKQVLASLFA